MGVSTYKWLIEHPISQNIIINAIVGLILLLIAANWKLLVAFSKLPPQQLGDWFRRARLNSLRGNLVYLEKAKSDWRVYIFRLCSYLTPMLLMIGLLSTEAVLFVISPARQSSKVNQSLVVSVPKLLLDKRDLTFSLLANLPLVALIYYTIQVTRFTRDVALSGAAEARIKAKIHRLREKLGEADRSQHIVGGKITSEPPLLKVEIATPLLREETQLSADSARVPDPVHLPNFRRQGHPFKIGARVRHPKYGEGLVQALEGTGEDQKITILFRFHGIKKLVTKFAQLESVS